MDEPDIISQLLIEPFDSRKFEDKLLIVKNGRPRPSLKSLNTYVADKNNKSCIRHFSVSYYENYNWLCGSETISKLFCWPCLLFGHSASSTWEVKGFDNLSDLTNSAKTHETSEHHMQCVMDFDSFLRQLEETLKEDNRQHNEKVEKNRDIFKRFINTACLLGKQQLPFEVYQEWWYDEEEDEFPMEGNFVGMLKLLQIWDPLMMEHFDEPSFFELTSSDSQKILISCISDVVKEEIKREIEETEFVAIMFDGEHRDECESYLSTVLRYVCKGESCVRERFIRFTNKSAQRTRTADAFFSHLKDIIEEFQLSNKFIAYSYDGAVVMPGHLSTLQKKIFDEYPKALHTHCYAHDLNLVLMQGLKEILECSMFFSTLKGIAEFSSQALEEHLKKKIPSFSPTKSTFTSLLVETVKTYWEQIVDYFDSVSKSLRNWSVTSIAHGYSEYLNEFQAEFLLNLFSPLFSRSHMLFQVFQSENRNVMEFSKDVMDYIQLLNDHQKGFICCADCKDKLTEEDPCDNCEIIGFEPLWEKTVSTMGFLPKGLPIWKRKKTDEIESTPKQDYSKLYNTIIDNLVSHIKARFSSVQKLAFFGLLDPKHFESYSNKQNFPDALLKDLENVYPNTFDLAALKNELKVFYRTKIFRGKSPCELMEFFIQKSLDQSFREIFRLARLISTIPATIASTEEGFSAFGRIQSYSKNRYKSAENDDRMDNLPILTIEQEILIEVQDKEDFHTIVSDKFATKTQRPDFLYK